MQSQNDRQEVCYRDDVLGDARMPGGSNAARTTYPSSGHRAAPPHVQAARRRQIQIDAMTGPRVYADVEDRLRHEADDAAEAKQVSHASAVNQVIMHSPSEAGPLGGDVHLDHPTAYLPHLFFGA
jgi:hypothetical protein